MAENDNSRYEVIKHIGVLEKYPTGWAREINLVSWNEGPAKFDIRTWNAEKTMMTRGITLTEDEARSLVSILARELNSLDRRISEAGLQKNNSDSLKSVETEIAR